MQKESWFHINEIKWCRVCHRVQGYSCGSLLQISSSPLPCAAWVILFQQHPCLSGEAWRPQTQTNHRQTNWTCHVQAHEQGLPKLSLSLSFLHSPCLSFSFIYTHTNSESQQVAKGLLGTTNWQSILSHLPYHLSSKQYGQMLRDFVELKRPVHFTFVSDFKVQIQIFKLHCPKSQGRMRGKLNPSQLNALNIWNTLFVLK